MGFYQACYTRIGRQERDAGWNVVAVTEGLSREALERFRAMASKVIRQKSLYKTVPAEIFFIQTDERFVYLCNMTADCISSDGRSNSFVHGFIIAKSEYYQRCRIPSSIFGLEKSEFIRDISELGDVRTCGLSKRDSICYRQQDRQSLLKKYYIEHRYDELMNCVLSVLQRKGASLCICMRTEQLDMLWENSREVLFCIMDGLPRMLRAQLTVSSFAIGEGKLFFSNQVPEKGQEFFDLKTGEWSCKLVDASRYAFLRKLATEGKNDAVWRQTESFFDEVFGKNGCSSITNRLIEAVYCYNNACMQESASEVVADCLNAGPTVCPALYQFLTYLLPWSDMEQIEESVQKKLQYLYDLKKDENYDIMFEIMMGRGKKNFPETRKKTEERNSIQRLFRKKKKI